MVLTLYITDTLDAEHIESYSTIASANTKDDEVNENTAQPNYYACIPDYLKNGTLGHVNNNADTKGQLKIQHLPLRQIIYLLSTSQ